MKCWVSGKDLKSVFIDIAPLLRKYDRARVIGISTTKTTMTFTVDTGTCYTRTIDISGVEDGMEMSITVMFTDLSSFIAAREEVLVELTQYFVAIKTKKANMSLTMGESIVAPYVPRRGKSVTINFATLKRVTKVFSGTTELQKAFNRDFAITFYGEYALMRSPTVWVHTKSQGLDGVLSLEQMKSIVAFQPELVEESDRLEFRKGNAILSIPRSAPTEGDKFFNHREKLNYLSTINPSGVYKELQEIKKNIGVSETSIHIYQSGFALDISKSGISLHQEYGVSGESTFSFKIMLDIFAMCLNILGDDTEIQVYGKGDIICLENLETAILLSV